MKIRRISENRNLVISTLRGTWLFDRAKRTGGHIKVALVGLGGYGRELLKALCWYTQIPGYTIEIHVFDASAEAQSRIECLAPELMERNGKVEEGECAYSIFFHCPIEVEDKRFTEEFGKVAEGLTAVFVTLGNDEKNIETAMRVRTQLGRMTTDPQALPAIYAVVYSTAKNEVAEGAEGNALADIRGNSYGIAFIGDLRTRYSLASIEHMELETLAQCCHMQYAATRISKRDPDAERRVSELIENYERYEYYRRTAIGQAVYLEALVKLGLAATRESEHNRWNAFMRAEGFLHSTRRDDIAKLHPDLVSFGRLSESDRRRDDVLQLYAIVSEYVHTGKLPQRKS